MAKIDNKEKWNFFTDETKNTPDIEKILEYSSIMKASDVHLHTGKHIIYRVEGVLIPITEEPILTEKHINDIKEELLKTHPKVKNDLEIQLDGDFGYVSKKNEVSFRVNGFWSLGQLSFSLRRIEKKARNCEEL